MDQKIVIDGIDGFFTVLNHDNGEFSFGTRKGYLEYYTMLHDGDDVGPNGFVLSFAGDEEVSLTPQEIMSIANNAGMIRAREYVKEKLNREHGIRYLYIVYPDKIMFSTGRSTNKKDYDIGAFSRYSDDDNSWGFLNNDGEQTVVNFSKEPGK